MGNNSHPCPACNSGDMEVFYRVASVPSNSCLLLESEEEARSYSRGSIDLGFCSACGFISNTSFNEKLTEYSGRYEETQGFSPTFRAFHENLANELIERHGLNGKSVVEIGCGKGEFLHLICALGDNDGLGFDPAYIDERDQPVRGERVKFVKDFFSDKYEVEDADFVACKMTLEHIPQARNFMTSIRESVHGQSDSVVFIQVPESNRIFEECAFEDIYYEHCSYFTPDSLGRLFEASSFSVTRTDIEYDGQYLTVEATYGNGEQVASRDHGGLATMRDLVSSFPTRVSAKINEWRETIDDRIKKGQKVVLWGSGSKGVSFLTTLGLESEIEAVVDINPNRQGYFMAGTGQKIVAPEDLKEINPDFVVVMNRIYTDEIREVLDGLGVEAELAAL